MTDLEDRIRELLDDEARSSPPPRESGPAIGRARRRQARSVVAGVLGAVAVIAVAIVAVRAVGPGRGAPATDPATTTTTINGVSITHPDDWFVFDPEAVLADEVFDEVIPPVDDRPAGMPRLVLGVSATDPAQVLDCPGMVEDAPPGFLLTIQEGPVALTGDASAAWPVPLEPRAIESAGNDPVESGEACYPGWELQRAGWTAAGRTFEARVGIAPGLADEDRAALIAAYESLAFEPAAEAPSSAVIATGTAAGEEWELVAERQAGGLALTLQGESGGSGGGGFEPSASSMTLLAYVIGGDAELQRVVFGAVPSSAVRIEGRTDGQLGQAVPVADVPDEIDPDMNAFVFATPIGVNVTVTAYDAAGEVVATGEVGAGGGGSDPVETPLPSVVDVAPEHGGRYWAVYIWAGASPDDPQARAARDAAEQLGFNPGGGDLACDDGAAGQLGVPQAWSGVAIYFETRLDAETAYEWFLEADPEAAVAPVGVAEVRTYCLD